MSYLPLVLRARRLAGSRYFIVLLVAAVVALLVTLAIWALALAMMPEGDGGATPEPPPIPDPDANNNAPPDNGSPPDDGNIPPDVPPPMPLPLPLGVAEATTFTIVHTSDTESSLLPVEVTETTGDHDGATRTVAVGGYARLASVVRRVERDSAARGRSVLVCSTGDDLQGRYYAAFDGLATVECLNAIGYDVVCPGNHEFDRGEDVATRAFAEADYDLVLTNASFGTWRLQRHLKPWTFRDVVAVNAAGEPTTITVGFFGMVYPGLPETTNAPSMVVDPGLARSATYTARALREAGADVVIALTHLGEDVDRDVARNSEGVDIILGGHSHRMLDDVERLTAKDGRPVWFMNGGRLAESAGVLTVDARVPERHPGDSGETYVRPSVTVRWQRVRVRESSGEDAEVAAIVERWLAALPPPQPVCELASPLDLNRTVLRAGEGSAGNLICDRLLDRWADDGADLAVFNAGGIRGDRMIETGPLTTADLEEMFPFGNTVCAIDLDGATLWRMFSHSGDALSVAGEEAVPSGAFLQVSRNVRVVYNVSRALGDRLSSLEVDGETVEPNDARRFRVLAPSYMANGGDGYHDSLAGAEVTDLYLTVLDALRMSLEAEGTVEPPPVSDRIAVHVR